MLNKKLRNLRTGRGITQAALAASTGVTPRAVKYWEQGTRTPPAHLPCLRLHTSFMYHLNIL